MPYNLYRGCALNYAPISCDWVSKFYLRNRHEFLMMTIHARIGMSTSVNKHAQRFNNDSELTGSSSEQHPDGSYTAYVNVTAGPSVFETSTVGAVMSWVYLQPTHHILGAPQDGGADAIARSNNLVDQNYDKCKGLAATPIPAAAAKAILGTSILEGIDPTLLSVTWRHESSFNFYPNHNPRIERGVVRGYDVGPLQISTNYYNNPRFTEGLPGAFGSPPDDLGRPIFGQVLPFNGNPYDNLRAGARAFTRDILGRSKSRADAAGIFHGQYGYQQRFNEFQRESPADDKFFNCLRGGG